MWGSKVNFWRNLEILSSTDAFFGRFMYSDRDRIAPLEEKEYLSYFLFDKESSQDLQIGADKPREYENQYNSKPQEGERTLFGSGGLTDLAMGSARVPAVCSRKMLEKMILIPEKTAQGIKERQEVFRVLSNGELRGRITQSFFNLSGLNSRASHERTSHNSRTNVSFLDVADHLRFLDRDALYSYPNDLQDLQLFSKLIGAISEEPKLAYLLDNMGLQEKEKFRDINQFMTSESHIVSLDSRFTLDSLRWSAKCPRAGLRFSDIALFDQRDEKRQDEVNKAGLAGIAYAIVNGYMGRFSVDFEKALNHLKAFEACLHMADFAYGSHTGAKWTLPEIVESDEPFIELKNFVHPNYLRDNVHIEELRIGGDGRVNVVTGSNDGGKTQTLRGLGQLVALAHAGLPIPAEHARMSRFSNILTNFAGKDDAAKGRYRRALMRWKHIFDYTGNRALVLADEPTDGTFPETGVKHGLFALQELEKKGSAVLMTTHYHDIARAVEEGKVPHAGNMHTVTNVKPDESLQHTYQIARGADYRSYGEEVARQVGFTKDDSKGDSEDVSGSFDLPF